MFGILLHFPITLGGNIVYINGKVVQVSLDFILLLGHDYFYGVGALLSSLFHVKNFPHEGRIVIIE